MIVSETSQSQDSVPNDSAETGALEGSQADDGSIEATNDGSDGATVQQTNQVAKPHDWKKRFDGLQAAKNQMQAEYDARIQQQDAYIGQLTNAYNAIGSKVDQLLAQGQGPQQPNQEETEESFEGLDANSFAKKFKEHLLKELQPVIRKEQEGWKEQELKRVREAQEAKAQEEREVSWRSNWAALQELVPDLDVESHKKSMIEEYRKDRGLNPMNHFIIRNWPKYIEMKMKKSSVSATKTIAKGIQDAKANIAGTRKLHDAPASPTPNNPSRYESTPRKKSRIRAALEGLRTTNNG